MLKIKTLLTVSLLASILVSVSGASVKANESLSASTDYSTPTHQTEIELYGRGSTADHRNRQRTRQRQAEIQPTGFFVNEGETIVINVLGDHTNKVLASIGIPRNGSITNYALKGGRNEIVAKDSGVLHLVNRNISGSVQIEIESDLQKIPFFVLGKTTNEEWDIMMSEYNDAPMVQLKSDRALISVRHSSAQEFIEDAEELMAYYDQFIRAQDRIAGEIEGDKGIHGTNPNYYHYVEAYNGYMFATDQFMGFHGKPALIRLLRTNDGWGPWHETGHQRQQNPWTWRAVVEATVNIYSLAAQEEITGANRLDSQNQWSVVRTYLSSDNKVFNNQGDFTKLAMFWQLHLTFGEEFYPRLHARYRNMDPRHLPANDNQKMQSFIVETSHVSRINLIPFFEMWGFPIEESTRTQVNYLPVLDQPIWENDNKTRIEIDLPSDQTFLDYFPDENLARGIAQYFNSEVTDLIPLEEFEKLQGELVLNNLEISNLEGMQHFRNLEVLRLADNEIEDLTPLGNLSHLRYLTLNNNQIAELEPLRGLGITNLWLYDNQIQNLEPLSQVKNLKQLGLGHNQITDTSPLEGLQLNLLRVNDQLITLDSKSTAPEGIFIRNTTGNTPDLIFTPDSGSYNAETGLITWGDWGENSLSWNEENFSGIIQQYKAVTFLDYFSDENLAMGVAQHFNRQAIDPVALEELENRQDELVLNNLGIRNLEGLQHFKNLEVLSLADNEIEDLTPLGNLSSLRFLTLNNNQITDTSPLEGLELNLLHVNNQLITLDSGSTVPEGIFIRNTTGKTPDLIFNPDSGSYNAETGLITWGDWGENSLSWNEENFSGIIQQNTFLTFLDYFPDENLAMGVAQRFNRQVTEPVALEELETRQDELVLNNLGIRNLEGMQHFRNLEVLRLADNEIEDLTPLGNLSHLRFLTLNNNQIEELEPLRGLGITNLWLDDNQIQNLEPLSQVNNLKQLGLDNNQITDLSPLKGLDLNRLYVNNQLITLDSGATAPEGIFIRNTTGKTPDLIFSPDAGSYNAETGLITWADWGENSLSWNEKNFSGIIQQYKDATFLDYFPDENLAMGVAKHFNRQVTEPVALEELENRQDELVLNNLGIRNLEGMQNFRNLEVLSLDDNEIEDLTPLGNLSSLRFLTLNNNQITDTSPLEGLELNLLHVNNQLITLDSGSTVPEGIFIRNTTGKTPDLIFNPDSGSYNAETGLITWGDWGENSLSWNEENFSGIIQQNTFLTFLDYFPDENLAMGVAQRFNRQVTEPVALEELETRQDELVLNNLGIRNLEGMQHFKNLEVLRLDDNEIEDLTPLGNLSHLRYLTLNNNQIAELEPLRGLGITNLWLDDNQITDTSPLEGLDLNLLHVNNQLITLDSGSTVPEGIFIRNTNGKTPDLIFNPDSGSYNAETGLITWGDWGENSLSWNEENFSGIIQQNTFLTFLDYFPDENLAMGVAQHFNRQATEPVALEDLETRQDELVLNNLGIRNLEGMQHFRNLEVLRLADNEIEDLTPLGNLSHLRFLTLNNNQIADLEPLRGLGITNLWLYDNQIQNLEPLSQVNNLKQLGLGHNQITDLSPLVGLNCSRSI